jgi:hypothetical protein
VSQRTGQTIVNIHIKETDAARPHDDQSLLAIYGAWGFWLSGLERRPA